LFFGWLVRDLDVLGDHAIQLPPDACVTAYETQVECTAGQPCPDPPIYELWRGAASLGIEARSGTVIEQDIVRGDTGAFDFLRKGCAE